MNLDFLRLEDSTSSLFRKLRTFSFTLKVPEANLNQSTLFVGQRLHKGLFYHIQNLIEVTYECMFTDGVFTVRVAGNVLFGLYHQLESQTDSIS